MTPWLSSDSLFAELLTDPRFVGDRFGRNFCERFKIGNRFSSGGASFGIIAIRDRAKKPYQIRWAVTMANPNGSKEWVDLEFLGECEPLIVPGLPLHKFQPGDKVRILGGRTHGQVATVIALRGYGLVFTDEPLFSLYPQKALERVYIDADEIHPEKFSTSQNVGGGREFQVGDRVKWRDAPQSIYQVIKPEHGGHTTIELVESNTKSKPPRRKRVALWEIKFLSKRPAIGTDLGFKVGDTIISKHRLSLGQIFEIAEYPNVCADGLVSYESLVTTTNLVLGTDRVSLVSEDSWNPAHFGEVPHQTDASGQVTIFFDDSGEPPDPDDFKTIEEYEEAWEEWNSLQDTFSQDLAATQKAQLPQDTTPSGQLKAIATPQPFTESDSPAPDSLSKTSEPLQTNLFSDSQYQMSQFGVRLVQTFPWLVSEMGLLEFADNCFLKDSDFFGSSIHPHLSLKTLTDSLAQTKGLPSRKSSKRLQAWGIAAPGNLGMAIGTSPKTENGFSSWAITAEVKVTQPKPMKKTLQEVFEAQAIPVKVYVDGVEAAQESPALCAGGWQHRSPLHRDKRGASFAVLYRAAGGDRIYTEVAPTLRSLSNADKHQSGSGAYKIREYQGENYLERPITATEAEQLMGWEVGSTAIGINREGDEITISQTQRIKMLGNGIIPGEITDILQAIKPILSRKLESEIPQGCDFAYKQLRQRGMSHTDAIELLT